MTYDLVIIGGGPCGASAAVFAARAGLSTAVVDRGEGLTAQALVLNHLGLPAGTTGPELARLGREHAEASGAEWIEDEAVTLACPAADGDDVVLATAAGRELRARDVLLAQGTRTALAASAGIATEPGREPWIETVLTVDADGRTSQPHVWAAGTVAGTSVHTIVVAGDGARVVLNLLAGLRGARYADHDRLEAPVP